MSLNEWGETTHNDTKIRFRVLNYRVRDSLSTGADDTERASGDKRFLVAEVQVASSPGNPIRVGRDQWTFIDVAGTEYEPADVTGDIVGGYPEEETLHNDKNRGKIVWEVEYWRTSKFEVVPYGDQTGGTVRIVED